MEKDYSEEVKEFIKKYKNRGFRYAKPLEFILERIGDTKENIEKELVDLKDLQFCKKQTRDGEIRYTLYYVYSSKKGRVYAISFEDKIVIITVFPLGRKTLKKYKKKFKS